MKNVFLISGFFIFILIFVGSYHHKYEKRLEEYYKHLHVIEEACSPHRIDPSIQLNMVTFDGLKTNCSISRQYANINLYVGTFHDMWVESPFYNILWLENPWAFWLVLLGITLGPAYVLKSKLDGDNQAKMFQALAPLVSYPTNLKQLEYNTTSRYSVPEILKSRKKRSKKPKFIPNLIDFDSTTSSFSTTKFDENLSLQRPLAYTLLNSMD